MPGEGTGCRAERLGRCSVILKLLQFEAKPDAVHARKLQELIGGEFGEISVTMQYLFQGWNCRIEGKYKDPIMDTSTEEIGHVEMLATMVARLLEGAPATVTAEAGERPGDGRDAGRDGCPGVDEVPNLKASPSASGKAPGVPAP